MVDDRQIGNTQQQTTHGNNTLSIEINRIGSYYREMR
jgi:hypothetical protein